MLPHEALAWLSLALALFLAAYAARSVVLMLFASSSYGRSSSSAKLPEDAKRLQHERGAAALQSASLSARARSSKLESSGQNSSRGPLPLVSILVATCNESLVVERLMRSLENLTYPRSRFEIVIVDDSTDDTFEKITEFSKGTAADKGTKIRAVHREKRTGWKGGALNLAIGLADKKSSLFLVIDADSVLVPDTLKRFVSRFYERDKTQADAVTAVQGFPVSKADLSSDEAKGNWAAGAIDFRLAQRNLIEFRAKNEMNLPIQITGSLFMVRADVLRATRFSGDLCEDWELTLDLYLQQNQVGGRAGTGQRPTVIFDPTLISYCEATTSIGSYFRQRLRVSEGHTRGFRKRILAAIMSRALSPVDKLELFFIGLQYAKYLPVLLLPVVDGMALLLAGSIYATLSNSVFITSLALQVGCLVTAIAANAAATRLCDSVRKYTLKDVADLLALNTMTIPAFAAGSLRGAFRNKGIFHRTQRNEPMEASVPAPPAPVRESSAT